MQAQSGYGTPVGLEGACEQDSSGELCQEGRQTQKDFKPDEIG